MNQNEPQMSLEAELLWRCARLQVEERAKQRIHELVTKPLDWTGLWTLAHRNGLRPLLSEQLNRLCADEIPPSQLTELRTYFQNNLAFNTLLTGQLVRLLKLFTAENIAAVVYKGPATAVSIYGNLALRQFSDLDILVRSADVWRATDLLEAEGFTPHFDIPESKRPAFIRLSYVRFFERPDGPVVELHWRVAPRFFDSSFDSNDLWSRLESLELIGQQVQIPAREDLLLMLSIHAAKDCWLKLEWATCIAALLQTRSSLDWLAILDRARQWRCRRAFCLALTLVDYLFSANVPPLVRERLRKFSPPASTVSEIVDRLLAFDTPTENLTTRIGFHLRTRDGSRECLAYCWRLATTTTPVDWAEWRVPRFAPFAYYPLRAFRLFKKYRVSSSNQVG
jgi:hypothetical protein